jgi:TRAP-type C4-dicarboxylate transport system permease small subunit
MSPSVKKIVHIVGVVCGFAASIILIVAGVVTAADPKADAVAPGKLISFGIAALAATIIATIDGARAFPQAGIWRIGAKFEGLGDLATLAILLIMGAGIGVSFAFT